MSVSEAYSLAPIIKDVLSRAPSPTILTHSHADSYCHRLRRAVKYFGSGSMMLESIDSYKIRTLFKSFNEGGDFVISFSPPDHVVIGPAGTSATVVLNQNASKTQKSVDYNDTATFSSIIHLKNIDWLTEPVTITNLEPSKAEELEAQYENIALINEGQTYVAL